jgi:hypothetical protein
MRSKYVAYLSLSEPFEEDKLGLVVFYFNFVLHCHSFRTEGATTPNETPLSARKVLGSIERGLNRVRHVLTPRRRVAATADHPAVLGAKVREASTLMYRVITNDVSVYVNLLVRKW